MRKKLEEIKKDVDNLTNEERLELFFEYCSKCGDNDPVCKCWDDE